MIHSAAKTEIPEYGNSKEQKQSQPVSYSYASLPFPKIGNGVKCQQFTGTEIIVPIQDNAVICVLSVSKSKI